jgi:hypothetical protein
MEFCMPGLMEMIREQQPDGSFRHTHVASDHAPRGVRVHRFISDPGHDWVSIAREEIMRLGLSRDLFGSMTPERVYISGDDMSLVLDTTFERGERFFYRNGSGANDAGAALRNFGACDPRFIENPVAQGRRVTVRVNGQQVLCQVLSVDQRKGILLGYVFDGDTNGG